jgi:hypothetical protein
MEKTCAKCGKTKKYSEFRKDVNKKDGYSPRCKSCLNLQQNEKYVFKRKEQEIIREGEILRIIIDDKKFGRVEVLCDADDYDRIKEHRWYMSSNGYVRTALWFSGKQKIIFLHRLVMECPEGLYSDHINRIRTDCRKVNLRICTRLENNRNLSKTENETTSKYKGVYKHKDKWAASITVNYNKIALGLFKSQEEAALAYNKAAVEYFGDFASTNKII